MRTGEEQSRAHDVRRLPPPAGGDAA
jgi:hypothetical protein